MELKLKTGLIDNAKIYLPFEEDRFNENQDYLLISRNPTKPYSIIIKVDEIDQNASFENPSIMINRNKCGPLVDGDVVYLVQHAVPAAKSLDIAISDEYGRITPGDWTASVRPLIGNRIFDFGDAVKIPLQLDPGILIVRGICSNSFPPFPVSVTDITSVKFTKLTSVQIEKISADAERVKIDRTKAMLNKIIQNMYNMVNNQEFEKISVTVDIAFEKGTSALFERTILNLFGKYTPLKENKDIEDKDHIISQYSFGFQRNGITEEVIELIFSGSADHATIITNVFARNAMKAEMKSAEIKRQILDIQSGLKKDYTSGEITQKIRLFVLEKSKQLAEEGVDEISLADLYTEFLSSIPNRKLSIGKFKRVLKEMDKYGALSDLKKHKDGLITVIFHPIEMTLDPTELLKRGQILGVATKDQLMVEMKWSEVRTEKALEFLLNRDLIKLKSSFRKGNEYYFRENEK